MRVYYCAILPGLLLPWLDSVVAVFAELDFTSDMSSTYVTSSPQYMSTSTYLVW